MLQILYTVEHKYNKIAIWSAKINRRCPRRLKYLFRIPVKSDLCIKSAMSGVRNFWKYLPSTLKLRFMFMQKTQLMVSQCLIKESLIRDG